MADLAQQLRDLQARRDETANAIVIIELIIFTNQQTLTRKQAQLAQTDPQDEAERARLENEIATLQTTVDAENARLAPLQAELVTIDAEIDALELQVFPDAGALIEPPPPPPPPPVFASMAQQLITTPVNAAAVLKTGLSTVKIPGLDPAQVSGLLSSAAAEVSKAKDAVTGAVAQATSLTSNISKAVSALGGAKAAAQVAQGAGAIAAISSLAKAGATAVTAAQGIGKFGLTPDQLELQGLIKPGAIQAFLKSKPIPVPSAADIAEAARLVTEGGAIDAAQVAINRQLNEVLASPAIWAGKDQINGIAQIVSNTKIQDKLQQTVVKASLDKVKSLGTEVAGAASDQLGALAQNAAKFGADAAAQWAAGAAPAAIGQAMNSVAKNAQQAVSLVNTQLKNFGSVPFNAAGAVATFDRSKINSAFAKVLGDPKISLPSFGRAGVSVSTSSAIPDSLLVYTGTDAAAWDNINNERLNRGLPSLTELGFPRP